MLQPSLYVTNTYPVQELDRANQLKHVVFPTDVPPEPDDKTNPAHQMYVRSHQAYLPGEQRRCAFGFACTFFLLKS